jgi:prepilin-type N-terminal cleavage/methylation domain-containing protein
MKLHAVFTGSSRGASPMLRRGFTLPELLVAMTVFVLLLGGVVFAHLYGLSMFRITETKLNATEDARKTMGRMANEIRTCKDTWVGNVKSGIFVSLLDGEKQQGTALLINPTTNSAKYILYFVNPADETFRRTTSTPGSATRLAESLTNTVVFSATDHLGTVLTNNQKSRVIHVNLEFYQPKRHMQVADYYKLETAVTRHASELP